VSTDIPEKTRKLIREREDARCAICRRPMTDIHHRLRKGMGGTSRADIHLPSNLVGLCRTHHGLVHAKPAPAVLGGWIVPTSVEPGLFPIWMQSSQYAYPGWFLLEDDGIVRWTTDDNEPLHLPPGMPSLLSA
jgi:5-methylcytosine-specific restriction protein A